MRGYYGSVHYSDEDQVFYGKLEFIRSVVTYEGTDLKTLRTAFEEAVEDYIGLCQEENREPETPFKGSFNVRTGPDLHRRAALFVKSKALSLNTVVTEASETYLPAAESS